MNDLLDKPDYKHIYLIPGDDGFVWCDDPAPAWEMDESDAVKYVRADLFEQLEQQLAEAQDFIHRVRNENDDLRDQITELQQELNRGRR